LEFGVRSSEFGVRSSEFGVWSFSRGDATRTEFGVSPEETLRERSSEFGKWFAVGMTKIKRIKVINALQLTREWTGRGRHRTKISEEKLFLLQWR
jgi:hypothetical protein